MNRDRPVLVRVLGADRRWTEAVVACACEVVEREREHLAECVDLAADALASALRARFDAELATVEALPCLGVERGRSCLDRHRLGERVDVWCQRCEHWLNVADEGDRMVSALPERMGRLIARTADRYFDTNTGPARLGGALCRCGRRLDS